jgi:hypothetical protein
MWNCIKSKEHYGLRNLTIKLAKFRQLTEKLRTRYFNSHSNGQLPHKLYKLELIMP